MPFLDEPNQKDLTFLQRLSRGSPAVAYGVWLMQEQRNGSSLQGS